MAKSKMICVLFDKVPEGTHFKKGKYSFLKEDRGRQLIDDGYGREYDPKAGKVITTETPTSDSTKKEIQEYLDRQGTDYPESATKAELLERV